MSQKITVHTTEDEIVSTPFRGLASRSNAMPGSKAVAKVKWHLNKRTFIWDTALWLFRRPILNPTVLLAAATILYFSSLDQAASKSNQSSPLGIGLNGVTYYTSEQPFLNIFKTAQMPWDTGGGANEPLSLDANGYPTSMTPPGGGTPYSALSSLMLYALPATRGALPYPAGNYVLLYDGEGTVFLSFDASLVSSSPGRQIYNVASPSSGIVLRITATDPNKTGNYIRNIRVVYSPDSTASIIGTREALLNAGEIFNPDFVTRFSSFRSLRFMDWMATNNTNQGTSWSSRTKPSSVSWANPGDNSVSVPAEAMVALANELGADPWFNMPHMATDDYVTQFATLVHQQLRSGQNVYVEYSNETWNYVFTQAQWIQQQGQSLWPAASNLDANRSYYGMRTSQICHIWKTAWGADANRVVCVMAGQSANTWQVTQALKCPLWAGAPCTKVNAIAIDGYFGYDVPDTWTSQPDGGLTYLFTEIIQGGLAPGGYRGGMIQQTLDRIAAHKTVAASYGLDLVVYEGGQGLQNPNSAALTGLYIAANRDTRMGSAYAKLLQGWKNAGGHIFSHFVDAGTYTKWGSWGALENVMQSSSPKYDALNSFITANPCWWSGCNSTTTQTAPAVQSAPTVTISSPVNGTKFSGNGSISISTFAADASGIASIVIKGDSTMLNKCTNTTSCTAQWQGKNISPGKHVISATAVNNVGIQGSSSITILSSK
jgi:Bacterial Ig domain